jgi:hypothetical protein
VEEVTVEHANEMGRQKGNQKFGETSLKIDSHLKD